MHGNREGRQGIQVVLLYNVTICNRVCPHGKSKKTKKQTKMFLLCVPPDRFCVTDASKGALWLRKNVSFSCSGCFCTLGVCTGRRRWTRHAGVATFCSTRLGKLTKHRQSAATRSLSPDKKKKKAPRPFCLTYFSLSLSHCKPIFIYLSTTKAVQREEGSNLATWREAGED